MEAEPVGTANGTLRQRVVNLLAAVGHISALGDCGGVQVSGPVHVSAHARLFLCSLPHRNERFLAKCYFIAGTEQPDIVQAKQQYDALVHLNRAHHGCKEFELVRPYHLFAEHGIVVQSWVEGQSLDELLSDRSTSTPQSIEFVRRAGGWLGQFHRAGSDGTTKVLGRGLWDDIVHDAQELPRSSQWLRDVIYELRASTLADGATTVPIAALHADFKPANVVATAQRIRVIDFQFSSPTSIYFDMAHFLGALTLDVAKSLRVDHMLSLSAMHCAFVEGYERVRGPVDARILAYYLNYDLIRYMLQYRQTPAASLLGGVKWQAMTQLLRYRLRRFRKLVARSALGGRGQP